MTLSVAGCRAGQCGEVTASWRGGDDGGEEGRKSSESAPVASFPP